MVKAPFPWFGGKSRVADLVWRAFGAEIPNFVEPFAGSLGVLLARPGGPGKIETVNDVDRALANFWRAVTADPDGVARWADWPVNEADMHARHRWLVKQLGPKAEFSERMHTDPEYFDVKIAGWWVWGICMWIGSGWCVEPRNHKHPKLDGIGKGVHSDRAHPKARNVEAKIRPAMPMGIHASRQRPDMGVHRKMPAGDMRRGVHASGLPSLGNDRGLHGVSAPPCTQWFRALQVRLRRVRVACGDWKRVLGPSVLGKGRNVGGRRPCGVLLDPPYSDDLRVEGIYAEDDGTIAAEVRLWALEHGDDPELRIALCGYAGEHDMPKTWACHAWKAARGYATQENENRGLERIWFSPFCNPADLQPSLFELDDG